MDNPRDYSKEQWPLSRVEYWLKEIAKNGGGGGGDDPANTASDEDIQGIEDQIWPDGGE